jgi:putative membrane protein
MQGQPWHRASLALVLAASAVLAGCGGSQGDQPVGDTATGAVTLPAASPTGDSGLMRADTAQRRGAMTADSSGNTGTDTAGATNPATFTDAHTFAMFDNVNSTEISAAGIALMKASSAQVKNFATRLVSDHRALLHESRTMSQQAGIHPQAPSDSSLMKAEAHLLDTLRTAPSGAAFDQLFVAEQIRVHTRVIQSLRAAARNVRSPELEKILGNALPILEAHLRAAQRLQRQLAT